MYGAPQGIRWALRVEGLWLARCRSQSTPRSRPQDQAEACIKAARSCDKSKQACCTRWRLTIFGELKALGMEQLLPVLKFQMQSQKFKIHPPAYKFLAFTSRTVKFYFVRKHNDITQSIFYAKSGVDSKRCRFAVRTIRLNVKSYCFFVTFFRYKTCWTNILLKGKFFLKTPDNRPSI